MFKLLLITLIFNISTEDKASDAYYDALNKANLEIIVEYVQSGVDVNETAGLRITPLMIAVKKNDTNRVVKFIEMGANVNAETLSGITAFMLASKVDNHEIAKILIENGADVTKKNMQGHDARHIALVESSVDVLRLIDAKMNE